MHILPEQWSKTKTYRGLEALVCLLVAGDLPVGAAAAVGVVNALYTLPAGCANELVLVGAVGALLRSRAVLSGIFEGRCVWLCLEGRGSKMRSA
jgi:hypothetical protein